MIEYGKTDTGAAASPAGQREPQKIKTEVREAGDDLASAAKSVAEEYGEKAEQLWADARKRTRTLQEDGEQYVRENPMKAILSVFGVGLVLGLIYRR